MLERYDSPEEYFRGEILADHCRLGVSRKRLMQAVEAHVGRPKGFTMMRKEELFHVLAQALGRRAYGLFPVGLPAHAFQQRFGLTLVEVGMLARLGVIQKTGERRMRDGSTRGVYNVWDYFNLSREEVAVALRFLRGRLIDNVQEGSARRG